MAAMATLALALCLTVDTSVQRIAEDSVRAAFVTNFTARAAAFGPLLDRMIASLRLTADAISTHGRLPDPARFRRVRPSVCHRALGSAP